MRKTEVSSEVTTLASLRAGQSDCFAQNFKTTLDLYKKVEKMHVFNRKTRARIPWHSLN